MKRLLVLLSLPVLLALEPVPEIHLDDAPGPVSTAIEEALARVETVRQAQPGAAALAEAYGHLGNVLFAHEFIPQARVAYTNATELAPGEPDWHYLLGFLEYHEGALDRALARFDRVLELDNRHVQALIRRGQLHVQRGELDDADRDFAGALQRKPDSAAALGGRGRVALDRGEFQRAVEYLERALELAPDATQLNYPLGMAYRGLGRRERAREALAARGDVAVEVQDPLLAGVLSESRSAKFYLESALAKADAGELEESRKLLETAHRLAPDNARILLNYGEVLARLERFEEAHEIFSRLVEVAPGSAEHHFYLGQIKEVRGEPDAAIEAYTRALSQDEGHSQAREARGFLHMERGAFEPAAGDFRVLTDNAAGTEARIRNLYWRGLATLGGGDCDAAAGIMEQARAATEGFVGPVMNVLARLRATCASPESGTPEAALEWAERLYQASPGLESAETLAMVQAALGRYEDAVDFQAQAMFEALKRGELEQRVDLQANMARYRDGKPSVRPYAPGDPVFSVDLADR